MCGLYRQFLEAKVKDCYSQYSRYHFLTKCSKIASPNKKVLNERIYYDLLLVDLNDINTFDKIIDFVTMEGLNNSRKSLDKSYDNSQIFNDGYKDCDTSNSGCLII